MIKKPFIFAYAFNTQLRKKFRNWFFGLGLIYSFAMVLILYENGSLIGGLIGLPPRNSDSYLLDIIVCFLVPYIFVIWSYVRKIDK